MRMVAPQTKESTSQRELAGLPTAVAGDHLQPEINP
jgi:hypothetical protein